MDSVSPFIFSEKSKEKNMQALFGYAGSKRRYVSKIIDVLPQNLRDYELYIEPFYGTGIVDKTIHKLYQFPHKLVNDKNPFIANLMEWVQNDPFRLAQNYEALVWHWNSLHSAEERWATFYTLRQRLNEAKTGQREYTLMDAARFLLLQRTCLLTQYKENAQGECASTYGIDHAKLASGTKLKVILEQHIVVENASIYNSDYEEHMGAVNKRTLVYLDPPYLRNRKTQEKNLYINDSGAEAEQERFYKYCKYLEKKGAYVLVSQAFNNGDEWDKRFAKDFSFLEYCVKYTGNNVHKSKLPETIERIYIINA